MLGDSLFPLRTSAGSTLWVPPKSLSSIGHAPVSCKLRVTQGGYSAKRPRVRLWERHAQEATALGFSGVYERYLAFQAGFPNDPTAYREAAETVPMPQASTTAQAAAFEE